MPGLIVLIRILFPSPLLHHLPPILCTLFSVTSVRAAHTRCTRAILGTPKLGGGGRVPSLPLAAVP